VGNPEGGLLKHLRLRSATGLVVASMIGAGIFTTTGFQASDLGHPGWILLLWIVGGISALCGALAFAELGAMMPEAGAEYVYVRETYGRTMAFTNAFIALFAGFSAPIAGAIEGLVAYLGYFIPAFSGPDVIVAGITINDLASILICWVLVSIHARGVKLGIAFSDTITFAKVVGIVLLIAAAFVFGSGDVSRLTFVSERFAEMNRLDFFGVLATSLIFVNFCYLGWNGAAYMAAEMDEPQRDLPRALLIGTGLVTLLYLGLNAVYLYGANVDELAGKVEVGLVSARVLFGSAGVTAVTALLCVSILASASAMTVLGPRLYYAFGQDFAPLGFLAQASPKSGAPVQALVLQGVVTSGIILLGTVDQIFQYAGFTLTLFACLAVSCVIVLRITRPDAPRPFRMWGYPFTPILFLVISVWTMIWAIRGRPMESLLGLATALAGGILCVGLQRYRTD
jgi:APA family basic amino acid/polyamine antiporter